MGITDTLKNSSKLFDFLIIGGGPASLTAAVYATRAALKVAFIEKDAPGGKMVKTGSLENYPGFETISGPDLSLKMMNHALANNAAYKYGEVIKVEKIGPYWAAKCKNGDVYYGRTLFIATGMIERKIGIPNEVEYYGKGVSYCAVCDGALYKNRDVIVVGGGNSAVEEAIYLSDIVKNVHVVHRRNEFRADAKVVELMKKTPNIHLHTPKIPVEVNVQNKAVSGLTIKDVTTNKNEVINGSCVFPYIGLDPVTNFVQDLGITDPQSGFIIVNENMQTKHPGLYAGGDVIVKNLRQVATAINDGAIAAIHAKNYITNDFKE